MHLRTFSLAHAIPAYRVSPGGQGQNKCDMIRFGMFKPETKHALFVLVPSPGSWLQRLMNQTLKVGMGDGTILSTASRGQTQMLR